MGGFGLHSVFAVHMKVCSLAVAQDLQMDDSPSITMSDKKAVLPQGNRAMPQVFFSVEVRQQHSLQYKTSQASKAATLQSSKHADA